MKKKKIKSTSKNTYISLFKTPDSPVISHWSNGITLIALVVTIVVLLILAGITISTLLGDNGIIQKAQEAKNTWENAIQNDLDAIANLQNQLYDEMNNTDRIPIYTSEQLLKIGTGEEITINEIRYVFDTGKTYLLQDNIEYTGSYDNIAQLIQNNEITFNGQGHQIIVTNDSGVKEYYTENSKYYIATNQYGYVLEGLQLYYDGIDNTGTGTHSNTATVWKDLSGNNRDGALNNFGTSAISGWNNNYLSFDGVNDWVNCGELNSENITLEAVYRFKSNTNVSREVFGNWETGGYGLLSDNGMLMGDIYVNSEYQYVNSHISPNNIKNQLMTQSLTYDGQTETLYIDGRETESLEIGGSIGFPNNNTILAIGANPTGSTIDSAFSDIDVYTVRIYNRGLSKEEIEVNNKADEQRFKNMNTIPVYTAEQLLKVGTGQQVTVEQENKTYSYATGAKYELKNNITVSGDYSSIINKINNKEIEIISNDYQINNNGNYYTANSKYTIAVNQYAYVTNGLQLLYDGIDNTGTGMHSNTATTWKDLSGNNRDGILQNMDTATSWQEDGLKFDGIDDYVLIGEMNYENVTLEVVNTMATIDGDLQVILGNVENGGYDIVQTSNNFFRFETWVNSSYSTVTTSQAPLQSIVSKYSNSGSYDGKTMKMRSSNGRTSYRELSVTGTIGKPNNNTYMVLGTNPTGTQIAIQEQCFNGQISSVRIYNRALTDEENAVNYLNDRDRYGV